MNKLLTVFTSLLLILAIFIPSGFAYALSFGSSIYVYTSSVQDLTQTSASLKGTVNPRDIATKVWFEWGPSANGLIYATPPQSIGNRNANIDFFAGVGNLSPDSVYYYRAVANNQEGIFYGSTVNFKTKPYSNSGNTSSGGFFGTAQASADQNELTLMAVTLSSDKTKIDRGEGFVLTARYQNIGFSDADNVVLSVELPKEIELQMAAPFCYYLNKDSLVFNLGRVEKDSVGEINIQVKTSDSARFGKDVETTVTVVSTSVTNSLEKKASDTLEISIVEKNATDMPAAAGFFSGHYGTWLLLSIAVNLFLAFYVFTTRRKSREALKI